jgi:putative SOS response-associated peptidase YedK
MPIILKLDVYDAWMDPATSLADVKELLKEYLDGELQMYRLSSDQFEQV